MELINAIAKARFASARPQRVRLHKSSSLIMELVCMEPAQQLDVDSGCWVYYVVKGIARLTGGGEKDELAAGHMATLRKNEPHTIANAAQQRLVCIAIKQLD